MELLATTDAAIITDPSLASVTLPEIVLFWACEEMAKMQANNPIIMGLTSFFGFINGSLMVYKRVQNTHLFYKIDFF